MEVFPHSALQIEVMIGVEDQAFPFLVVIVIRVFLVAICDIAIGTHLEKPEGLSGSEAGQAWISKRGAASKWGGKCGVSAARARGTLPPRLLYVGFQPDQPRNLDSKDRCRALTHTPRKPGELHSQPT